MALNRKIPWLAFPFDEWNRTGWKNILLGQDDNPKLKMENDEAG